MSLLPADNSSFAEIEFEEGMYPTKTYAMDLEHKRIIGKVDEQEAMKQAIYKIVNTERFVYRIYSNNYGIELEELFGMPISYVLPELKRYIIEALTWDERINSVDNFDFEVGRGKVHVTFTAHTIFGNIDVERTVSI